MKLIPNKGYLIAKEPVPETGVISLLTDLYAEVVAVSEDSPLCKVGDKVVVMQAQTNYKEFLIIKESDVVAWVEENDV